MSRTDFDVHAAVGPYRVHKANGWRRGNTHDRFAAAEAEALRLVAANPGESFVITREVACVKGRRA